MANNDFILTIESDDDTRVIALTACSDLTAIEFAIREAAGATFTVEDVESGDLIGTASGVIADRYTLTRADMEGNAIGGPRSTTGQWVVRSVSGPVSDAYDFRENGMVGWTWAVDDVVFTAVPDAA